MIMTTIIATVVTASGTAGNTGDSGKTIHEFPALVEVVVHADPCECDQAIEYHPTAHHHYLTAAD